ncbi:hypothetical protein K1T71_002826 [Dendrolimus kikuchii]|uniref:Uncharacterized protein n=1 Tax=Dendrolimus kikuchii TaxID=765133 RepID=A0ACC1DDQ3_9NEOP|nr:hypothetical protein K1T71_002826 [Dendrolimus kikuchii]
MVSKFVALFALVAVVSANDYSSFSYGVADPYTGDYKNQVETRAGGNVAGQYSLLDSDGTRRVVDYAAGANGFNAVVRKDPALIGAAPIAAAPIAAAPIYRSGLGISPYGLNYGGISPLGLGGVGLGAVGLGYGGYGGYGAIGYGAPLVGRYV